MTVEDEQQRLRAMSVRERADIVQRGVRNPREAFMLANFEEDEEMIGPLTAPVLPHFLKATCSKDSLAHIQTLIDEVHVWASGLVGLGCTEADVLYNGDPTAVLLRDEWIAWAVAYTHERLARHNPRDQGEPYRKFYRLYMEICGWLDKVCLTAGPRVALWEVAARVAAEIWDATVGQEVRVYPAEGEDWIDYGQLHPKWHRSIRYMVQLYGWNEAEALAVARKQFTSRASGELATLVKRRCAMAADIVETRALLIAGYDANAIACVQPGGWTTFEWDLMHSTGVIVLAVRREQLLEQEFTGQLLYPLRAGLDGRLAGATRWWEPCDDVAWEVALLEPLHSRLVEAWLARVPLKPPHEEPPTAAAAVAVVADACQRIADPVEGRQIPAVRMQSLLHMLERRFSCEVAAGKGSEVTVYRPGGRKFTLGHHTRNTHVPAHVVRALLKAVGIAVTEWWRACARA